VDSERRAKSDEDRWLTLAQAVSRGEPVNWDKVEKQTVDPEENDIVRALRALDGIARVHKSSPLAPAIPSKESEQITVELERWRHLTILERVGQGTFGIVYRAHENGLDREVALKLLRPKADRLIDPDAVLNEARLLARVRHPNVVTVYGAESIDGQVGVWMEFIRGRTLEELLASQGSFGAREAAAIGIDLCHALAAVHGAGLLHRDVKCQNVMREEGGRIVLMDFGAGAELPQRLATLDDLAGTPLYLAPELLAGGPPSIAADIYSLGVLLFHLVSNGYPVEGDTKDGIQRAHEGRERRRLRDLRPDLPDAFVRVIERALATDPKARHATAGTFADELAASLGFLPESRSGEQRSDERATSDARQRARYLLTGGITLLVAAVAGVWWTMTMSGTQQPGRQDNVVATNGTGALPNATVVDPASYEIGAKFHVMKASQGSLLKAGDRLKPGDRLFLTVESSKPVYVYVINQDERGQSYLLFPLSGYNVTNPLPGGFVNRLPGARGPEEIFWMVDSVGEREHFFVFASPDKLDQFEQSLAALPRPALDRPVTSLLLPKEAIGTLRSVGALAKSEAAPAASDRQEFAFATPLKESPETTRGFWAREIVFTNPAPAR
jgi:eukaryotic-like serine/threonine-protein kinase